MSHFNMRKLIVPFIILLLISSCKKEKQVLIGKQIQGDFNGDSKLETAYLNSEFDKTMNLTEYTIIFSDSSIQYMKVAKTSSGKVQLINEGDLNDDKADDISISYEQNKTIPISHMETRSFKNSGWNTIIEYFTMYVGFDTLSHSKLQSVVSKKNDSIIYYTYGNNISFNENLKKVNTPIKRNTIKIK